MPKTKKWSTLAEPLLRDPVRARQIAAMTAAAESAISLNELRNARGHTQVEVAVALGVTQGAVSQVEHADDPYLSTLRDYVEALGGELQLHAVFDDLTVTLIPPTPAPARIVTASRRAKPPASRKR